MGREIVHHIVERLSIWELVHVALEHLYEGIGGVIGVTLKGHVAISAIQESEHVQGAIADVLEFFKALSHIVGLQIGYQTFEDLNARALVEEE